MPHELPADRLSCPWQDEARAATHLREALSGQLDWSSVRERCGPWIESLRRHPGMPWALESLLNEFPLNSQEGLALMRLAEAILRVPDADTALALTADQLHPATAPGQIRHDTSWLASFTQRVLTLSRHLLPPADREPTGWLQRFGGPAVVNATVRAMQVLGQQFVLAQTVEEALKKANRQAEGAAAQGRRMCFSLDMLGEGARTHADAARYLASYRQALSHLAQQSVHTGRLRPRDTLSIKLSALHPRLEPAHANRLDTELLPSLTALVRDALAAGVSITLDAEESWRLELQLHVLDQILTALDVEPAPGAATMGLAVQAYQYRAMDVIDQVAGMARRHQRPLTVRLVKGAYWDTEVKRAQELGLPGFPVFTEKAHTDLNYLACARQLLAQHQWLVPQFATHNATTVAAVMQLASREGIPSSQIEWQRLHGMGEATWREILADPAMRQHGEPTLRIYAPVGSHRDLLAYLVRRLLENGANASFIHQLIDRELSFDAVVASPLMEQPAEAAVCLPVALYGAARPNAMGLDLHYAQHRQRLEAAWPGALSRAAAPAPATLASSAREASLTMSLLAQGAHDWALRPVSERCMLLERCATRLEDEMASWAADLVIEARKTWPDAVAEVREAIDYARYYAQRARDELTPRTLPGPTGELSEWRLQPRGVWVCIAPWNFPLAIFGGQLMAALVTGNVVAAKPAPQTPRIATRLVALLHTLGIPPNALVCVCGGAQVGHALVSHPSCAGVAFTGSVDTARSINRALAMRDDAPIVPLIAETGGLNALIADSSVLPEQLLDDVMSSAFGSAGQRCSALRLLCLHSAIADGMEVLLAGALQALIIGPANEWTSDVGPVIDIESRARLLAHMEVLDAASQDPDSGVRLIGCARDTPAGIADGELFVPPRAYALPQVNSLTKEHFGPLLHVVRWGPGTAAPSLDDLIDQLNATGYGLTLGVHTRIESRAEHVTRRSKVGNVYVNRGMTGAVVGSQPFGGQGLSGTGPKAGGPLYLSRFCTEQVVCINTAAAGGNAALMTGPG